MANVLSADQVRGVGEQFARKAAAHWGMTYAELEAAAMGEGSAAPDEPEKRDFRPIGMMSEAEIRAILRDELERMLRAERAAADREPKAPAATRRRR